MNCVERVKSICKERKIPISKLERDLGFSNGYIGQLRKGTFPTDRLVLIAEYLDCPIEYLMYGEQNKKPAATNDSELKDPDSFMRLQQANDLFLSLDEAGKAQALAYLKFLASQQ